MIKIVLTRSMLDKDIQYIKNELDKEVFGQYNLVIPDTWTEETITELAVDADILLGPYVSKKILDNALKLKLIQIPWTGTDTFDFSAVQGRNVLVCNTHSNADAVAELGLTLILELLKKVAYHDRKMRNGNWNRDQMPLGLTSKMLSKQIVCIMGYGNIGSRIGRLTFSFGAKVIAVDNSAREDKILSKVYRQSQITEALAEADVIVCTLPLTENTKGLIGERVLSYVKKDAVLVNLSRADIINEDAIWNALEGHKVSGFASDVWWNAPERGKTESYPSKKHEFWKLDNVIMSPHRAGFVEGSLPHLDGAIDNVISLIKGKEIQCIVDIQKGY